MADDLMAMPAESEAPIETPGEPEAPIGVFQKADGDLVSQIRAWWKEDADAQVDVRKKRETEWANLAGHQWDETDKKRVEDGGRPALTLNLLLTIMAAVEGEERTNRQEIKLYGEGEEDDSPAHNLNRLIKWVVNQCGGEFALSQQFKSGIAVGEGWITVEVDYFDDPEGQIRLVYVKGEEAYPHALSECPVGSDMGRFHRVKMMAADEMEARWPGSTGKVRERAMLNSVGPETDGKGFRDIYLTPNNTASPKYYDAKDKLWAVLETCWTQIEMGWVVLNEETDLLEEMSEADYEQAKVIRGQEQTKYLNGIMDGSLQRGHEAMQIAAAMEAANSAGPMVPGMPAPPAPPPPEIPFPTMPPGLQAQQRPLRKVYRAFTAYETLLEKSAYEMPTVKRLPYVPFRAIFDNKLKEWFGLLRPLLDPQKQHNVEQSAIVQLVQLMPKASWMGPKGVFHNKQEWETKVAKPGQMLEYNDRRGKPEQIQTPAIPRHMIDMAMSRPQVMREISGVNVEMTGVRQGSDPGVVMEQRSKAAKTVLAPLFDNHRWAKKELGKILLAYIQKYVSKGRKIRVLGEEGARIVEMTAEMQSGRYDVMVEETNQSINDRIATLNVLQTTLPQLAKAGMPIPPETIDLLPMDPHVRDAMKRMLAWDLMITGKMPPPDWNPGDPDPRSPMLPPGMAPPGGPDIPLAA